MIEDKKVKNEEISDEQANEVAGGIAIFNEFTCAGCGKSFFGAKGFMVAGKAYCMTCLGMTSQKTEGPQTQILV